MSTTAKLIYGYLIRPAQKRYKDEAGRVDEENDFLAKISQSCLINPKNVAAITDYCHAERWDPQFFTEISA